MILYHFTSPGNVASILKHGLIRQHHTEQMPPWDVVWFTSAPQPDQRIFCKTEWEDDARIKVAIPSGRRLMRWHDWFKGIETIVWFGREWTPEELLECGRISVAEQFNGFDIRAHSKNYWIFFGDVGLDRFRAIEYADPKMRAAFKQNAAAQPCARSARGKAGPIGAAAEQAALAAT
jgi:hypothetical protein